MTPTREQDGAAAKQLDVAIEAIRRWRAEPVTFVREVFGAALDEWQADALAAFPLHKRNAMVACKGPGKTTTLAWMGWNFLATRPHCKVPCTSITGDNLKDGLWAEFSKWQKKSPLLMRAFTWTKTRIFENRNPETWFASARTWAQDADQTQQANTVAGLHEDYLLWLLDEVSDMPDGVVSAAEAALTGGIETRMAIAGNCTRNEGPLYRAAVTDRHLWHITRITGDPDDPKRSPRIDIEECRRQIEKYGRQSYVVRVNILGLFPERQADKLLDISDVDAAMARALPESAFSAEAKVIGVDVARQGDDASVFFPRQGRMCFQGRELRIDSTVLLAEELIKSLEKWDADGACVDGTGIGAGVIDQCRSRGWGHLVHEIQFGMRATEPDRFENRRAEMYWKAAEWVKHEGGCLPRDPLLSAELCAPIYWYDKRGRVCIESKDDIKKRLGRSPDRADGFVLTFATPIAPKPRAMSIESVVAARHRVGSTVHEYDPYAEGRA